METENLFDAPQSFLDRYFPREYRTVFALSIGSTLLTHFYLFTNLFINHDNINGLFSNCAFGVTSGRWLLHAATYLAGDFSSPWLDGIIGALMLAATCTLFAAIFNVRRPLPAALLTFCMASFPTVTSIYTYMFTASQYFASMLLAVLAVWLFRRDGIVPKLIGAFCIACSMGIYQAFFCFAAATLVLTMVVEVLEGRWKKNTKDFFVTGFRYLGLLALGLILYLVITKLSLWYTGTELVDYQGISSMGQITLPVLLRRIKEAYFRFRQYYFKNPMYAKIFPVLMWVGLIADAVVIGFLFVTRRLYKNASNFAQLAVLLVIFPLACHSVYLMTDSWAVHNLMVYPAILPLLLPVILGNQITGQDLAVLRELSRGRLSRLPSFCACGLLLLQAGFGYQFFIIANRAYTSMSLTYESAYAYCARLTAKIELQESYSPDTHIAILGKASLPATIPDVRVTGALSLEETINMYSRYKYLDYFMGGYYRYASREERDTIQASAEFQQMPCYPAAGSIATIDGIIVVKMSE